MSFLCALPLVASLISGCAGNGDRAVGYVEGDFVLMAPVETARLVSLSVHRGDRVHAGQTVATFEKADAQIAVQSAEGALLEAGSNLDNLRLGKRPEEIAVLEADLRSAAASEAEAQRVLKRQKDLAARGIAAQSALDDAETQANLARAKVAQAKATLHVAELPARPDEIKAAEARVTQARTALEQARWRLSQRVLKADRPGRVDDVIRNPGEIGGPSAPVLSILPDGATKLRVFVPEANLASVRVGGSLPISCDGCPPGLTAHVTYVSPDPEFTPPVIYSLQSRQKLVYLVEARPDGAAERLKPGQIVDADLGSGGT